MLEGRKDAQSVDRFWEPVEQTLLDGVEILAVRHVMKDAGHLTELYRRDWGVGPGVVDQVFQTMLPPGTVSAWHSHRVTTDHLFVNAGRLKIVLYDGRDTTPSAGRLNVFRAGDLRPMLIVVPPGVWHGVQNIGSSEALLINMVDAAYDYEDPDHWRLPADSTEIPHRWD